MKKLTLYVIILIQGLALSEISVLDLNAQTPWFRKPNSQKSLQKNIHFMITNSPIVNQDSVLLKCYIQIPHSILQFIRKDTLFSTDLDLTIALQDKEKESVGEHIIPKAISTTQYSETIANDLYITQSVSFIISPGNYTLIIDLHDTELEKPVRHEEKVMVPDYSTKPLSASDLIFFHQVGFLLDRDDSAFPTFPPSRSVSDSTLYGIFYIYSQLHESEISIIKSITDDRSTVVFKDTSQLTLSSGIHPVMVKLNQDLSFGQYILEIELISEKARVSLQSPFYIRWGSHTPFIPNLDQAVEVLYYILKKDEYNRLKDLMPEEKQRELSKFWKDQDPDPGTPQNELEEEYYRRVAMSNEHFSSSPKQSNGWRTDRGRIYIIYGPPSYVERPPLTTGGPSRYEIWYYKNLQRKLYFLDKYGTGDHRLVSEE